MFLSKAALDLVSAALRHVRDAEWLVDAGNPQPSADQAWHLAGYAPECARKATLQMREFDKTIGHRFGQASEDVLDVATALDPIALRYAPRDWAAKYPILAEWTEAARYDRTGTVSAERAVSLAAEARRAVNSVVVALWADGRLPDGDLP